MSPEFLFLHVPKRSNYYKPIDDFMFINYIPMGVFALCDTLVRHGVDARIKHLGLECILDESFSISQWVRANRPKVVGMSLHWHYQAFDVIDVARKIKEAVPETIVVLGGFTASRFPREILENCEAVDAIIAGDAERGIVPFARAAISGMLDFSEVPNCVWRRGQEVVDNGLTYSASAADLDILDYANLGLLDHHEQYRDYFRLPMFWANHSSVEENLKKRIGAEKLFPLAIGRGCRVNCTFCGGSEQAHRRLFNRHAPVLRSTRAVVDSMAAAVSYGYTGFVVCFDPDPKDDTYFLDLMAEVRRRRLRCALGFESWGLPTPAFIDAFVETFDMKRSYIAISAESGSEEIRRRNKGVYYSNQELNDTLELMKARQVPAIVYLTLGLPGETPAHIAETARFAKALKSRFSKILEGVYCLPVQLEPGAAIFEEPEAHGVHATRSCFMDFYRSHGRADTGPFSHIGYSTEALEPDQEAFARLIQEERCKHYCLAAPRLLGKYPFQPAGRLICKAAHAKWKHKQLGAPAKNRPTFA